MSLKSRSVYLAGPIENCTHEEMWDWRNKATAALSPIHCFNPCKRIFDFSNGLTDSISKQIVTLDKAEIAASDALLVGYNPPAAGSKMTGTTMEIIYAFERGKLVVVVSSLPTVSPWVDYHSHIVVRELDEGIQYIRDFYERLS